MKRSDFRFLDRLRVRWAEVDLQKIVFNGHYLMYFDTAVAGYWRALALPYHQTMEQLQGDLYVRKATLEYEGSARYDDQLEVGIRCDRIGNSSMVFAAAAFRGEQRLVHGELVYVFADPATQTSRPVPPPLREWLHGFEAGQSMIELRCGSWGELGTPARTLRHAVFVADLGLPQALVADERDDGALHVVARNRMGLALACGRLLSPAPGLGQIGRLATLPALRGAGFGQAVLTELIRASRQRGDREVVLQAAASALRFYERAGFRRSGGEVFEAGEQHIEMRLAL